MRPEGTDEILSALSLLAERIGGLEETVSSRFERIEQRMSRIEERMSRSELILRELARKLLAPAECRALGITPNGSPEGRSYPPEAAPIAAKPRE